MKECPVDIEKLYNDYITLKNEENYKSRYEGKEKYYHASGGGSCSRKLYFESIDQTEPTNPTNELSNRIMRLGTIVHEDFELALRKVQGKMIYEKEFKKNDSPDTIYSNTTYSNTTYSNTTCSKEKETHYLEKESFEFHIEKEIILPELNVRGFYDLVAVSREEDGGVYLIDFKTIGSFPWSRKFGWKNANPNPSIHQEIQLSTYGLFVEKEFGRLDGMYLYFYNKDTSRMRAVEVPLSNLKLARSFWKNINEEHEQGLPMFREGVSPVEDWNCKYCRYLDHCNPPFFKRK
jgi:CRISPR/Cas system-associated exonuclease Cas4 (RecB family)